MRARTHLLSYLLPPVLLAGLASPATAQQTPQEQNQLDASQSVFAVLAAINAAGFDAEIDNPENSPLRKMVRDYIKAQNPRSLIPLRGFIFDHRPKDRGAELGQYISYALSIDGPPDFKYRYPESALAPDVTALDGLSPLLAEFYKEAKLDDFWKRAQPYYDQAIERYHGPVARAVLEVNGYLRNTTNGYLGRNFQIYVDLLGSPNQVQSRSYVDDYFVVVTPASEPPVDRIRHAYLHYLLDPLPFKFSDVVMSKRGLGDYAGGSPILESQYKSDFMLLTTESLIKAVESRLDRTPASPEQAMREGFVMTPAFAEGLATYEKQEQSMRLYFPDLVQGIDLKREETRLDHIDFATTRSNEKIRTVTREVPAQLTGAAKTLDDAEKAYLSRDLAHAKAGYLQVLEQTTVKSMHAKAYYGLARVAVLERDPETGDRLFRKVLDLDPDPDTKSWSLLYLGRLADSQGDRQGAQDRYQAVLAVKGAPDSVRQAAEKGLKQAFLKK